MVDRAVEGSLMKVSYFETGRYRAPADIRAIWPMPATAYDSGEGVRVLLSFGIPTLFGDRQHRR